MIFQILKRFEHSLNFPKAKVKVGRNPLKTALFADILASSDKAPGERRCRKAGVFMEQITIERMKRTQIILLLAAFLLFLGGCGKEDGDSVKNLSDIAVPMSGGVDIEHFGSEEWTGGNVGSEENRTEQELSAEPEHISHEEAEYVLEEDFIKSCVSIFVSERRN